MLPASSMNPVDKRIAEIASSCEAAASQANGASYARDMRYLLALCKRQREALEEIGNDWPVKLVPEPGDPDEAEMWEKIARARKKMARKALAFSPDQEEAK